MSARELLARALAGRRVAWVAPDVGRTLGLARLLPDPVVLCHDAMGAAVDMPVHEVQADPAGDDFQGSLSILNDPSAQRFIRHHRVTDLVLFKVNARIISLARDLGLRVLAGDPAVAQRFEHKLHFARMLQALSLPAPPTLLFDGPMPSWSEAARELGEAIVVQGARGHSGQSTHLARSEVDYEHARARLSGRGARLTTLVEGVTLTINGCAAEGSAPVGRPYIQLTGIPGATPHALGACGNAFEGDRLGAPALRAAAERIGVALSSAGYRGIFGVDAVLDAHGAIHVIEVNPRMISGSSLEALLQSSAGVPPAAAHVLAVLGAELPPSLAGPPVTGGQIVIYSPHDAPCRVVAAPPAGRYRLDGASLHRVDGQVDPTGCAQDEVVLLARSPGRAVPPTGEIARVQTTRSLLDERATADALVERLIAATTAAVRLGGPGQAAGRRLR
ncbi:MAG: hypothetical protein AMXMBFR64_01310 [Myxococcales bacterium]